MNLRTSDRLRFAVHLLQFLLAALALWIAVFAGIKVQRVSYTLERERQLNFKQTKAIYLLGAAIDELNGRRPDPNAPGFRLDQMNGAQNLFLNFEEKQTPMHSTEKQLVAYRSEGRLPKRMTRYFLHGLTKRELGKLTRHYADLQRQRGFGIVLGKPTGFYNRRHLALVNERQRRGYIQ